MDYNSYSQYDALGLAALIKKKEVSAEEVLEAAISRAQAVNDKIFAINYPLYERARKKFSSLFRIIRLPEFLFY